MVPVPLVTDATKEKMMETITSPDFLSRKRKFDSGTNGDLFPQNREKKIRKSDGRSWGEVTPGGVMEESVITELQAKLNRKESEILSLRNSFGEVNFLNEKLNQEKNAAIEENTILKKAIQLLDKKYKESAAQVQELQSMLGKSVEYIQELERQNRNLAYHLSVIQSVKSPFDQQPPPDVF